MDLKKEKQSNNLFVFQTAVSQAFNGISESVSEEEFKSIIAILQSKSSTARKLSKAFNEDLDKNLNISLKEILVEGSLAEALKRVSSLLEEAAPIKTNVWRPSVDVKLNLRSHDAKIIQDEYRSLEQQVLNVEAENEEKMRKLLVKRKKFRTAQERTIRLLTGSNIVLHRMDKVIELMEQCIKDTDYSELRFD
ncbi:polyamine-modulated factor 1-like [Belonocnema kinseyi]|uniref:polyamine-modulated factor 1-like n=1 Tax=Belonocnema kinseyi TaxID=2817044 RepID=UPI00143CE268|nr:polyamine-modulated factor 1-like [Belonocnema kinseyi]